MARRKKDPDQRRTHIVHFRLSDAEKRRLAREARKVHLKPAELARIKTIGMEATLRQVFELPPDLVLQIGRWGVNLNQIARQLNMTGEYDPAELNAVLAKMEELLNTVLSKIIYPE